MSLQRKGDPWSKVKKHLVDFYFVFRYIPKCNINSTFSYLDEISATVKPRYNEWRFIFCHVVEKVLHELILAKHWFMACKKVSIKVWKMNILWVADLTSMFMARSHTRRRRWRKGCSQWQFTPTPTPTCSQCQFLEFFSYIFYQYSRSYLVVLHYYQFIFVYKAQNYTGQVIWSSVLWLVSTGFCKILHFIAMILKLFCIQFRAY